MPILNYTTTVSAEKSISEITSMLSRNGANNVSIDYEHPGGIPVSISFRILIKNTPVLFALPCNWRKVQKVLQTQTKPKVPASKQTDQHSLNVAWRIIKDWIAAQIAIIESETVDLQTVFLPYAKTPDGTIAEVLYSEEYRNKTFLLGPAK